MAMRTTQSNQRLLLISAILFTIAVLPTAADELKTKRAELGQWIMTYYLHPEPEQFVERVRSMSKVGMLHDPSPTARPDANVMFLGKIMAANPTKISEWLDALSSLPVEEKVVVNRAAWYSGTAEANAWLQEHGEVALAKSPRPTLLAERQVMNMQPYHLDELWEWFFATGEAKPVGRIVSLFSLAHEPPRKDTSDLLAPPKKPIAGSASKADRQRPKNGQISKMSDESLYRLRIKNYRLLKPAMWSCTSLAIQQNRVLEILKNMESDHYHTGIKAWLGQIIKIAEDVRAKKTKR
jgi:hypothetical protein